MLRSLIAVVVNLFVRSNNNSVYYYYLLFFLNLLLLLLLLLPLLLLLSFIAHLSEYKIVEKSGFVS